MRRWVPWLGFALFGAAACQVVVGETELTTVNCQAEGAVGPPACAVGQVCLNGVCVPGSSAADGGSGSSGTGGTGVSGTGGGGTGGGGTGGGGTGGTAGNPDAGDASDTGVDAPDDGVPPDVGPDVPTDTPVDVPPDVIEEPPPTMKALGETCGVDTECNSGHCFQVPNKSTKVCSKFCCGSGECTLVGGVCVAYDGANACFSASHLDLVLGSKSVGDSCNNGVECASGRCSGTCIDSCCTTALSGCSCALAPYGGEVNWYCGGPSGSTGNLATCSDSSDCASNNCESFGNAILFTVFTGTKCGGPCCSDDDCDGYCEYVWQGSNAVRQCTPWSTSRPSDHRPCCGESSCSGSCQYGSEDGFDTGYSILNPKEAAGFRCH
jgi:hypothetical protein